MAFAAGKESMKMLSTYFSRTWKATNLSHSTSRVISTFEGARKSAADDDSELSSGAGEQQRSFTRENSIDEEEYIPEPMLYTFASIPPDHSASRLSDATKENIWSLHNKHPDLWTIEKIASEYRIRQQRVHAILWLKDIEKKLEKENGAPLDDEIEKTFEQKFGTVTKAIGEKHWKFNFEPEPLEEEEDAKKRLHKLSEEEDKMMLQEFVQRITFNKKLLDGNEFIKVNKLDRRRPAEGWSYVVEELGPDGKRGRKGRQRFVALPDGTHRSLSDLEKEFLQREKPRPRRRLVPR